ncbi:uncharacterized protein FTJAE_3057 [Fusarium tjaetaba]|uniref:Uncharacterized protein n=1 Tax=Fusarium tjaetaba TaxID=1567544 RepID=A0A8H5W3B4_9HYPO|nr:uncharacterized protein FTJAE_3057 [Fusarium tjaetaba]KAF5643758.1 hypothetical protein FTJAE_3057 [Fusarium tjaetaba]
METKNEHSQESGQLALNTEREARRSRSPRPSLKSKAVRYHSPPQKRPSFPTLLGTPRFTPLSSTKMPLQGRQRERTPPRQQTAPGRLSFKQGGHSTASHATVESRLIEELGARVESQNKDIRNLLERVTKIEVERDRESEKNRKIEEQEGLIKTLQEENRMLKRRLDSYAPSPHVEYTPYPSDA